MKNRIHRFLRATAIATLIAYLPTSIDLSYAASGAIPLEVAVPSSFKLEQNLALGLPAELGRMESFRPGSKGTILHIQTAHGHYEAQEKIEKLLGWLSEKFGNFPILLEGAADQLDPSRLEFFPGQPEANLQNARWLAKKSLATGAELFLLRNKNAKGIGVESEDAYRKNHGQFARVLKAKKEAEHFSESFKLQMEKKAAVFAPELRAFLKRLEQGALGIVPLDVWLPELRRTALKYLNLDLNDAAWQVRWPMMVRFFKIQKISQDFNSEKFESEKAAFLIQIQKYIPASGSAPQGSGLYGRVELLLNSVGKSVQLPEPETENVFTEMLRFLPSDFDFEPYREVGKWIALLVLQSQINFSVLAEEISRLESLIAEKLARGEDEKNLLKIFSDYRLLEKLLALQLTPSDFDKVNTESAPRIKPSMLAKQLSFSVPHLAELDFVFDEAVSFYQGAKFRDDAMIQRAAGYFKQHHPKFAVLVTGGFHSKPMREHFEKAGYAYGVVTPAITGLDEAGYQAYLKAMLTTAVSQPTASNQMIELALGSGPRLGEATQLKRAALTVLRVRTGKALAGWRAGRAAKSEATGPHTLSPQRTALHPMQETGLFKRKSRTSLKSTTTLAGLSQRSEARGSELIAPAVFWTGVALALLFFKGPILLIGITGSFVLLNGVLALRSLFSSAANRLAEKAYFENQRHTNFGYDPVVSPDYLEVGTDDYQGFYRFTSLVVGVGIFSLGLFFDMAWSQRGTSTLYSVLTTWIIDGFFEWSISSLLRIFIYQTLEQAVDVVRFQFRDKAKQKNILSRSESRIPNKNETVAINQVIQKFAERAEALPKKGIIVVLGNPTPDYPAQVVKLIQKTDPQAVLIVGNGAIRDGKQVGATEAFRIRREILKLGRDIPRLDEKILLGAQDRSMNTGENVGVVAEIMARQKPQFEMRGIAMDKIILTQMPAGMLVSRRIFEYQWQKNAEVHRIVNLQPQFIPYAADQPEVKAGELISESAEAILRFVILGPNSDGKGQDWRLNEWHKGDKPNIAFHAEDHLPEETLETVRQFLTRSEARESVIDSDMASLEEAVRMVEGLARKVSNPQDVVVIPPGVFEDSAEWKKVTMAALTKKIPENAVHADSVDALIAKLKQKLPDDPGSTFVVVIVKPKNPAQKGSALVVAILSASQYVALQDESKLESAERALKTIFSNLGPQDQAVPVAAEPPTRKPDDGVVEAEFEVVRDEPREFEHSAQPARSASSTGALAVRGDGDSAAGGLTIYTGHSTSALAPYFPVISALADAAEAGRAQDHLVNDMMGNEELIRALAETGLYKMGGINAVQADMNTLFFGASPKEQLAVARKMGSALNLIRGQFPHEAIQLANMFLNGALDQPYDERRLAALGELLSKAAPTSRELGANVSALFTAASIEQQNAALDWIFENGIFASAARIMLSADSANPRKDEGTFYFAQMMLKLVNVLMKHDDVRNAAALRKRVIAKFKEKITPEVSAPNQFPPVMSFFMYHSGETGYDFFTLVEHFSARVATEDAATQDAVENVLSFGASLWPDRFFKYLQTRYSGLTDDMSRARALVSLAWSLGGQKNKEEAMPADSSVSDQAKAHFILERAMGLIETVDRAVAARRVAQQTPAEKQVQAKAEEVLRFLAVPFVEYLLEGEKYKKLKGMGRLTVIHALHTAAEERKSADETNLSFSVGMFPILAHYLLEGGMSEMEKITFFTDYLTDPVIQRVQTDHKEIFSRVLEYVFDHYSELNGLGRLNVELKRMINAGSFTAIRKPLEMLEQAGRLQLPADLVAELPVIAAQAVAKYKTEDPAELDYIDRFTHAIFNQYLAALKKLEGLENTHNLKLAEIEQVRAKVATLRQEQEKAQREFETLTAQAEGVEAEVGKPFTPKDLEEALTARGWSSSLIALLMKPDVAARKSQKSDLEAKRVTAKAEPDYVVSSGDKPPTFAQQQAIAAVQALTGQIKGIENAITEIEGNLARFETDKKAILAENGVTEEKARRWVGLIKLYGDIQKKKLRVEALGQEINMNELVLVRLEVGEVDSQAADPESIVRGADGEVTFKNLAAPKAAAAGESSEALDEAASVYFSRDAQILRLLLASPSLRNETATEIFFKLVEPESQDLFTVLTMMANERLAAGFEGFIGVKEGLAEKITRQSRSKEYAGALVSEIRFLGELFDQGTLKIETEDDSLLFAVADGLAATFDATGLEGRWNRAVNQERLRFLTKIFLSPQVPEAVRQSLGQKYFYYFYYTWAADETNWDTGLTFNLAPDAFLTSLMLYFPFAGEQEKLMLAYLFAVKAAKFVQVIPAGQRDLDKTYEFLKAAKASFPEGQRLQVDATNEVDLSMFVTRALREVETRLKTLGRGPTTLTRDALPTLMRLPSSSVAVDGLLMLGGGETGDEKVNRSEARGAGVFPWKAVLATASATLSASAYLAHALSEVYYRTAIQPAQKMLEDEVERPEILDMLVPISWQFLALMVFVLLPRMLQKAILYYGAWFAAYYGTWLAADWWGYGKSDWGAPAFGLAGVGVGVAFHIAYSNFNQKKEGGSRNNRSEARESSGVLPVLSPAEGSGSRMGEARVTKSQLYENIASEMHKVFITQGVTPRIFNFVVDRVKIGQIENVQLSNLSDAGWADFRVKLDRQLGYLFEEFDEIEAEVSKDEGVNGESTIHLTTRSEAREWKNPNSQKIVVIGTGFVGATKAVLAATDYGHDVVGVEASLEKREKLARGEPTFTAKYFPELLKEAVDSGRLNFTSNSPEDLAAALLGREIVYLALPTPQSESGEADIRFLKDAVRQIANAVKPGERKILIGKSTAPPKMTVDTLRAVVQEVLAERRERNEIILNSDIQFAWEPEFLREGAEVEDDRELSARIVIGAETPEVAARVKAVYENFNPNLNPPRKQLKIITTDLVSAPLVKYAANGWRGTKISFINYISWLTEELGFDIDEIANAIGEDSRVVRSFLNCGLGFGGSCFPKDLAAFVKMAKDLDVSPGIVLDALAVNQVQVDRFVSQMINELDGVSGKKIVILGGAFKPETSDTREARSIIVARELLAKGANVIVVDPDQGAIRELERELQGYGARLKFYSSFENQSEIFSGASAIALVTEWREFKSINFDQVRRLFERGVELPKVFDGRNALNGNQLRDLGFKYFDLGRGEENVELVDKRKFINAVTLLFLALRISYMNTLAEMAEKLGANIHDVKQGFGYDPVVSNAAKGGEIEYLNPGLGWGGYHLPRAVDFMADLSGQAELFAALNQFDAARNAILEKFGISKDALENTRVPFVDTAKAINQRQIQVAVEKMKRELGRSSLAGVKIAVAGLAHKQGENIDSSPSIALIQALAAEGAEIHAWDPDEGVRTSVNHLLKKTSTAQQVHYFGDLHEAMRATEMQVIAYVSPEFLNKPEKLVRDAAGQVTASFIFDARHIFVNPAVFSQFGVSYAAVGMPTLRSETRADVIKRKSDRSMLLGLIGLGLELPIAFANKFYALVNPDSDLFLQVIWGMVGLFLFSSLAVVWAFYLNYKMDSLPALSEEQEQSRTAGISRNLFLMGGLAWLLSLESSFAADRASSQILKASESILNPLNLPKQLPDEKKAWSALRDILAERLNALLTDKKGTLEEITADFNSRHEIIRAAYEDALHFIEETAPADKAVELRDLVRQSLSASRSELRMYDVASAREALTKIKDHTDVSAAIRGQAGRYLGGLGVSGGRRGSSVPRHVGDFLRKIESQYPQVFRSESRMLTEEEALAANAIIRRFAERQILPTGGILAVLGNPTPEYPRQVVELIKKMNPQAVLIVGNGGLDKDGKQIKEPEYQRIQREVLEVLTREGLAVRWKDKIFVSENDKSMNTGQNVGVVSEILARERAAFSARGISLTKIVLTQMPAGMLLSRRIFEYQWADNAKAGKIEDVQPQFVSYAAAQPEIQEGVPMTREAEKVLRSIMFGDKEDGKGQVWRLGEWPKGEKPLIRFHVEDHLPDETLEVARQLLVRSEARTHQWVKVGKKKLLVIEDNDGTYGNKGYLTVVDQASGTRLKLDDEEFIKLSEHNGFADRRFDIYNDFLIVSGANHYVFIYDLSKNGKAVEFSGNRLLARGIFSLRKNILAIRGATDEIVAYDLDSQGKLKLVSFGKEDRVYSKYPPNWSSRGIVLKVTSRNDVDAKWKYENVTKKFVLARSEARNTEGTGYSVPSTAWGTGAPGTHYELRGTRVGRSESRTLSEEEWNQILLLPVFDDWTVGSLVELKKSGTVSNLPGEDESYVFDSFNVLGFLDAFFKNVQRLVESKKLTVAENESLLTAFAQGLQKQIEDIPLRASFLARPLKNFQLGVVSSTFVLDPKKILLDLKTLPGYPADESDEAKQAFFNIEKNQTLLNQKLMERWGQKPEVVFIDVKSDSVYGGEKKSFVALRGNPLNTAAEEELWEWSRRPLEVYGQKLQLGLWDLPDFDPQSEALRKHPFSFKQGQIRFAVNVAQVKEKWRQFGGENFAENFEIVLEAALQKALPTMTNFSVAVEWNAGEPTAWVSVKRSEAREANLVWKVLGGKQIESQTLETLFLKHWDELHSLQEVVVERQDPKDASNTVSIRVEVPASLTVSPAKFLDTWFESKNAGLSFSDSLEHGVIRQVMLSGYNLPPNKNASAALGVAQEISQYLATANSSAAVEDRSLALQSAIRLFTLNYEALDASRSEPFIDRLADDLQKAFLRVYGKSEKLILSGKMGGTTIGWSLASRWGILSWRAEEPAHVDAQGRKLVGKPRGEIEAIADAANRLEDVVGRIIRPMADYWNRIVEVDENVYDFKEIIAGYVLSAPGWFDDKGELTANQSNIAHMNRGYHFDDPENEFSISAQLLSKHGIALSGRTLHDGTAHAMGEMNKLYGTGAKNFVYVGPGSGMAHRVMVNGESFTGGEEIAYIQNELPNYMFLQDRTESGVTTWSIDWDLGLQISSGTRLAPDVAISTWENQTAGVAKVRRLKEALDAEGLSVPETETNFIGYVIKNYPTVYKKVNDQMLREMGHGIVTLIVQSAEKFGDRYPNYRADDFRAVLGGKITNQNDLEVVKRGAKEVAESFGLTTDDIDRMFVLSAIPDEVREFLAAISIFDQIVSARSEQRAAPTNAEIVVPAVLSYRQTLEAARLKLLIWLGGIVPQRWLSAVGFADAARQVRALTGNEAFAEEIPVERLGVLASGYAGKNYVAKPETAEFSSKIILDISFLEEFLEAKDALGLFALLQNSTGFIIFDTTGNLSQRLKDKINNRRSKLSAQQKQAALDAVKALRVVSANSETLYGEISALAQKPDTAVLFASAEGLEKISGKLVMALRETLNAGDAQALVALIRILKQAATLDTDAASDYLQRQIDGLRRQGRGWLADSIQSLISSLIKNHELVAVSA